MNRDALRAALPAHAWAEVERQLRGGKPEREPPRRSKYHNQPVIVDNIRFDSKKEADYYGKLKLAMRANDVLWFCRQPIFDLPGGVQYRADFIVAWSNAICNDFPRVVVVDVKGVRTKEYRLKRRQVESIYNVKIVEVT